MSTTSPPPSDGQSGPEYLEQGGGDPAPPASSERSGSRRTALLAGGAVAVLAIAGAGTWAAVSFLGSGAQPAEALPSGTLAYASVDLDPSGSQKIAAYRMLEKFPAIKEELDGFNADDDLRRKIFEQAECDGLSYDDDVAPWIGTTFAVAAVDAGEDQPSPVGVLAVTDDAAAEKGLATLSDCEGEGDGGGFVVDGDWAYVAETEEIAQQVADGADEGTLADNTDFQKWTGEVGDPGVITMYASPDAGPVLGDLMASDMAMGGDAASSSSSTTESGAATAEPAVEAPTEAMPEELKKAFEDFGGAAATVRFADGGVEVELAGAVPQSAMMTPKADPDNTADLVGTLPTDTAVAYGVALPSGWAQQLIDSLESYGIPQEQIDQGLAQAEAQTGLTLPEDVETLLGQQVAVALGSGFDMEQLVNSGDPSGLPVGVKVQGDADQINAIMEKLGSSSGLPDMFQTETEGDTVAWSLNPDYRSSLVGDGGLGDSETFQDVVPEADRANGVFYVDFDAGDWLTSLTQGDTEAQDNLEPLSALGISSRVEGETTHALVRLTTD